MVDEVSQEASAADLWGLLDESRRADAAGLRARERSLRQQAGEEATWAGTVRDLADGTAVVSVRTVGARVYQGRIGAVGADFCLMRLPSGRATYLALEAITSVRGVPGVRGIDAVVGSAGGQDVYLGELLASLAPERPRVTLFAAGDTEPIPGELRSVGRDVLTVRLDAGTACHVRLAAVTEVVIDPA